MRSVVVGRIGYASIVRREVMVSGIDSDGVQQVDRWDATRRTTTATIVPQTIRERTSGDDVGGTDVSGKPKRTYQSSQHYSVVRSVMVEIYELMVIVSSMDSICAKEGASIIHSPVGLAVFCMEGVPVVLDVSTANDTSSHSVTEHNSKIHREAFRMEIPI